MDVTFRWGGEQDLPLLENTRLAVLRAANGLAEEEPLEHLRGATRQYYSRALQTGEHAALLCLDGEVLCACGGVSYYTVLPTCDNPTGKKAYIMNMYTAPVYRRRGLARMVLERLVRHAKAAGAGQILLEATDAGRPLYQGYGFVPMQSEWQLPPDAPG